MRKTMLAIGILLVLGLVARAGDVWKDKPYKQWTQQDCKKVLSDSPWSHVIQVDAPWKGSGGGSSGASGGSMGGRSGGSMSGGGNMGGGGGSSAPSAPSQGDTGGQTPMALFVVRWNSSHVVREALTRSAALDGQIKEQDMDRLANAAAENYEILVGGPDMSQFEGLDEDALKAKATLLAKKSKQKFSPASVKITKGTDGKSVVSVLYIFAKKGADGQPVFGPQEKSVEFNCQAGRASIKTNFELSKMQTEQGQDL